MFQGDEHALNLGLQRNGSGSGLNNVHGGGPYWSKRSLTLSRALNSYQVGQRLQPPTLSVINCRLTFCSQHKFTPCANRMKFNHLVSLAPSY
jgi:hypothetical protein